MIASQTHDRGRSTRTRRFGYVVALVATLTAGHAVAQEPCPSVLRFDADGPATEIDPGWTGIAHDNHYVGLTLTMGIGGCAGTTQPSCGTCSLSGPLANGGGATFNNRRCADKTWLTCTTTGDCAAAGASGPCEIFFGPPLPYSAGGVSVCVTNEITAPGSGSLDVEAGSIAMSLPYLAKIYNGISLTQPCPRCVSGVCNGGQRNGMPCTTNGTSSFFGDVSFDCPPTTASLTGSLVPSGLDLSTGSNAKTLTAASPVCDAVPSKRCMCDSCNGGVNAGLPCDDPSDCPGAVCGSSFGEPTRPNACIDDTSTPGDGTNCVPTGNGEGQCPEGPITKHCAIETYRGCNTVADCPAAGESCVASLRECFLDNGVIGGSITSPGLADPPVANTASPLLGSVFCIPPTVTPSVNVVAGFPGPGRLRLPGTLTLGDEIASGTVGGGGTVTTDTEADGATAADPIETSVTSPNAGEIIINEQAATGAPPGGFEFLGKQVDITAPPATPASPLVFVFRIDASRIPSGEDETTIEVFRNGTPVGACTGAGAVPDPCVALRQLLGDGDVQLTVRTSAASIWNFGTGTPVLDHFTCYSAGASKDSVKFGGAPGLSLVDEFAATTAAAKKPKYLCAPTNDRNQDPAASSHPDHLEAYAHTSTPKFGGSFNRKITDEFGTIFVDVKKPSHLLVPTAKSLVSPPSPPSNGGVDHFQCYQVKDRKTPKFTPTTLVANDQFGAAVLAVQKPRFLCAPVDKNGETPGAETHPAHLMCYQAKHASDPKFVKRTNVFVANQFGSETLDAKKEAVLCVPALVDAAACQDVHPIGPAGAVVVGSTTGANGDVSLLSGSCGGALAAEQVYSWTPTDSGVATIETCGAGTNYDTLLYVRQGTCDSPAAQIACNDDACGLSSRVQLSVVAGQTYFIVVDGFIGEGDFTLTVKPPAKRVFVTSTTQSGNMGNLAGADAICQSRAMAGGLTGSYKAWLSSATTSAASRLTHSSLDYALVDGTVIAHGWTDLTDGALAAPINKTELGGTVSDGVWTNCTVDGNIDAAECLQWSSTTVGHKGQTGLASATNSTWTHNINYEDCALLRRLYCLEQ